MEIAVLWSLIALAAVFLLGVLLGCLFRVPALLGVTALSVLIWVYFFSELLTVIMVVVLNCAYFLGVTISYRRRQIAGRR
jgi:hypothetical protein